MLSEFNEISWNQIKGERKKSDGAKTQISDSQARKFPARPAGQRTLR